MTTREVLFIDNFDSFTFNLVEAFERLGCRVRVLRNRVDPQRALTMARDVGALIVLSPGPGHPADAGCCVPLLALAKEVAPVFGVCLGHQAMVHEAGGAIESVGQIVHGKSSVITHDGTGLFAGLPSPLTVGRYHSLCARQLPTRFHVHARLDGMAMAIADVKAKQVGVQFHPESILTPHGDGILKNVLETACAT